MAKQLCDDCTLWDTRGPILAKLLFYILITLAVHLLASSGVPAAESIEVTREVLLESGRYPIPYALAQTKEGGYVIAGSDQHIPWATRTDAQGNVQWRYVLPMKEWTPGAGEARYEGTATLIDDSTMLCGFKEEGDKPRSLLVGLLTKIDKVGRTVSNRLLYPQSDHSFRLSYLHKCVPWGDGIAIIGSAFRSRREGSKYVDETFLWLLALDADGNIRLDKLIPLTFFNGKVGQPLVMPNQDLVFSTSTSSREEMTEIVRVDINGNVMAQRKIRGVFTLVHSTAPDSAVRLFPIHDTATATLYTLGTHLEDIDEAKRRGSPFFANQIYLLPDHTLVLFGYQREESEYTATVVRLSADLSQRQDFVFQPVWASSWIADALPTDKLNDFVTVREIHRVSRGPNEKRIGLVLGFIHVK